MSLTNNDVLSADIDKIIAECDIAYISTSESLTYATAVSDSIASFVPVLAKEAYAGAEGGFAMVMGAQDVTITSDGTAVAISFVDSGSTVLHVESATSNVVYATGNTA